MKSAFTGPTIDPLPKKTFHMQVENKPLVCVYLVRHGETQENREGIIQGQKDTVLNATGQKQVRSVGEKFKDMKIDWLVSSDLMRATSTAEAIVAHHPGLQVETCKELRERNMGQHLEGLNLNGFRADLPPPTESIAQFRKRTSDWWNKHILGHALEKQKRTEDLRTLNVVVTTHGGFISALTKTLADSRKARVEKGVSIAKCFNASVTVIDIGENRKGLVRVYGDTSHLLEGALESSADQMP